MILAAGLSPAWQQIVVLDGLAVGEVNRAREVHWCASGKVLNVGLAVHGLLRDSESREETRPLTTRTLALIGDLPGEAIRREFAGLGVSARWIEARAPTRVCTTILDSRSKQTTELVENAGPLAAAELAQFEDAYCDEAGRAELVVLTGSLPAGVRATFYRELLDRTPGRVILDAQGDLLLQSLPGRPFLVKPNREELARTLGRTLGSDAELHAAMREICRRGATWVVITQGHGPVWIASERDLLAVAPPTVEVVNPIGSGDCLAAGIAVALRRGEAVPEAVQFGVAAAAENVRQLLPARLDPARVRQIRDRLRS